MTFEQMKEKRDLLLQRIMEDERLAAAYQTGSGDTPQETGFFRKLTSLNQAIADESANDCGCGKNMRMNIIQGLLREAEKMSEQIFR